MRLRLGSLGVALEGAAAEDAGDRARGARPLRRPGAPPVVRDQLVQPYLAGLTFARALWSRGGAEALREAWGTAAAVHRAGPAPGEVLLAGGAARRGAGGGSAAGRSADVRGRRSARCCSGRWWRTRARPRRRVGRGRLAALGRRGADGAGVAQRVGRRRPMPGSSTPRCGRASRGTARPARAAGWEVFPAGSGRRFAVRRAGDAVELVSADDGAALRPDDRGVAGSGSGRRGGRLASGLSETKRDGTERNGKISLGRRSGTARGMALA